jgi:hypothetical protein
MVHADTIRDAILVKAYILIRLNVLSDTPLPLEPCKLWLGKARATIRIMIDAGLGLPWAPSCVSFVHLIIVRSEISEVKDQRCGTPNVYPLHYNSKTRAARENEKYVYVLMSLCHMLIVAGPLHSVPQAKSIMLSE